MGIHPSAIIDPSARIAENVEIGPWTFIGKDVEIDSGTVIGPHVVIEGPTQIGKENKIFQFASLGAIPQDKKFKGETTWLKIGHRNTIREFCTFNRGTVQDKGVTQIGDDNLFMAYVHIAHDCHIGNSTIFANNASLAGHVIIEDFVSLGGFSGVFQKCRIGKYSFASMGSMIDKDVPPFVKVSGYYAKPYGLNVVGMKRYGFSEQALLYLTRAYKVIYRKGLTIKNAVEQLRFMAEECQEIHSYIDFIEASERGIVR